MLLVAYLFFFKWEIQHSIHTLSNNWDQNVINFSTRQKFIVFSKIYIIYILYIYLYTKAFCTILGKGLSKNVKKRRDGEIEKNEMGALNMKQEKWNKLDKSKRSSYSPVVFKHGCSLETHLELWRKRSNTWAFVFFKKILICIWVLKSDYRFLH